MQHGVPFPADRVARVPSARPVPTAARGPLALLIAGRPDEADTYSHKLRADGYAVIPATGLERALELAGSSQPDLIFVCMGAWAVPALLLFVLRSDRSTRGVPTVLVTDHSRAQVSAMVGGLLPTENVVPRSAAVHADREERALSGRSTGCGHRPGWDQWPRLRSA